MIRSSIWASPSVFSLGLLGRPVWPFWLFGRPRCFSCLMLARWSGTSCAFRSMPIPGRSSLNLTVPTTSDLMAVSLLVIRPVSTPRRRLVVVMGGRGPLPDGLPQLLILTRHFSSEVLNASGDDLHLPLNRSHGRVSAGSVVGSSFHGRYRPGCGPFCSKNDSGLLSRPHRRRQLIMPKNQWARTFGQFEWTMLLPTIEYLQNRETSEREHRRWSGGGSLRCLS
jgi:hypothetical protein